MERAAVLFKAFPFAKKSPVGRKRKAKIARPNRRARARTLNDEVDNKMAAESPLCEHAPRPD